MANQHGIDTAKFGKWLTQYFSEAPLAGRYWVFYDHGDSSDPSVAVPKAFVGTEVKNRNRLADVDLMIAGKSEVEVLIELEERESPPKKILGDVLAILLADRIAVRLQTQRYFDITSNTRLVIAGLAPSKGDRLWKIENVVAPGISGIGSCASRLDPQRVELIFTDDIGATTDRLKARIRELFPQTIGVPGTSR